jgi:hypothetical protein
VVYHTSSSSVYSEGNKFLWQDPYPEKVQEILGRTNRLLSFDTTRTA